MSQAKAEALAPIVHRAAVIPVLTIEDARQSIPLARTLVDAGLPVLEVTLRTPAALDAIAAMAKAVPEAVIGAGTVVATSQIAEAIEAGARFIVTPGTTDKLARALAEAPVPALPGCATVSEAMALADCGFEVLKFFPAAPSGGPAWLKAVAGPLPNLRFCPTGGLDADSASAYLALPNVVCVGGAWMAPAADIGRGAFDRIAELARRAAQLRVGAAAPATA